MKFRLKGQFGALELQQGLLHADRGEEGEVPDAPRNGGLQRGRVGGVVDGPGVLRRAGPAGEAGHDGMGPGHRVRQGVGQASRDYGATG